MRSHNVAIKKCTTCFSHKGLKEFYSKGSRIDSSCKECIKNRKRLNRAGKSRDIATLTIYGEIPQKPVKIEIDKDHLRDIQTIRNNLSSFFHLAFDLRKECSRKVLTALENNYEVK